MKTLMSPMSKWWYKHKMLIAHHSFVSCFEPTKVEEALQDPDWINVMHEELNNFTHNEVWTLEERPQVGVPQQAR